MKKTLILIFILMAATSIHAQTITLGSISPLTYCDGDTITVSYSTIGSFASDNHFFVELSNANGSFTSFTRIGNDTALNGTISFKLGSVGSDFHVKVSSTDPYAISDTNGSGIQVFGPPSPHIAFSSQWTFIGDTIQLSDNEPAGSQFLWDFNDSDASIYTAQTSSVSVTYSHEGPKSGLLTVTSPKGCRWATAFSINILSCTPTIPKSAFIVEDDESASEFEGTSENIFVWVKAGGDYDASSFYSQDNAEEFIFVEPGATVKVGTGGEGNNIFYIKPGASIQARGRAISPPPTSVAVLDTGDTTIYTTEYDTYTFFCPDLTFDYSQVEPSLVENPPPTNVTILQSGDHLFVNDEGSPLDIRISNILGTEMLSQHGSGALDVDLSPLPAGVYFAVIQAGNDREIKRIAVVH